MSQQAITLVCMAVLIAVLCTTGVTGQQGVTLSLNGSAIDDNGYVDVNHIGAYDGALLCHTNKYDCCGSGYGYRAGEWFFPDGSHVLIYYYYHDMSDFFYRNRGDRVVRLNRLGNPLISGQFRCQVPNADGVDQTVHVNILNMSSITVTPSGSHIRVVEESFNIQCSVTIYHDPLPQSVPYPTMQWFHGPANSSLPSGVTSTGVTKTGNYTYTSMLQFSALQDFQAGMYTCRVGGNEALASTSTVTKLSVEQAPTTSGSTNYGIHIVGESLQIHCSLNFGPHQSPTIQWFYGPSNSSLPHGVISTGVTKTGDYNYTNTLQFSPLQRFHAGMYTCRVGGNEALAATSTLITVSVISAGGASPIAGESFTLICDISGIEYLESSPTITYQWTKNNGTRMQVGTHSNRLHFSTLRLSDAGGYTCDATIDSEVFSYIEYLDIQIPPPHSISISSDPASPIEPIGSNVTLTGTVELSTAVDVPVTVSIQIADPSGSSLVTSTSHSTGSTYTSTATVSTFWRDQSGNYTCSSTVISSSPFHIDGDLQMASSFITTGPYLSLRGGVQANNSAIFITGIGETLLGPNANTGLQCVTDRMPCCRAEQLGEWFFPNGSTVETKSSGSVLYQSRGLGDGTINLNRRTSIGDVLFPTGLYCCVAPTANGVKETLCVRIVSVTVSASGSITAGDVYTLECSANGALATFQWFDKSGNQVTNGDGTRMVTTSPLSSWLQFSPLHLSHGGNYTCYATVEGVVDSKSFIVSVSAPMPSIRLVSNSDRLNPIMSGRNLSLTCSVEFISSVDQALPINTVWTTPNGQSLASSTPPEATSFTRYTSTALLGSIESTDAGEYTCTVSIGKELQTRVSRSITVGDMVIQLRLTRTDDCQLWTPAKAVTYRNAVEEALVEAIERRCKCSFPIENLLEDSFSCDKSAQATVYRSILVGTLNFNATQIATFIEDWVHSEPKIKIEWFTVGVDGNCPVVTESLEKPECGQ